MAESANTVPKTVLHVGCGSYRPDALHPDYQAPEWQEIRLDINPETNPDVVASMTDMGNVRSDSVDAIWNSHALEHLHAYEVPVALAEFHRVLRPGGHVFLRTPDLQKTAEMLLEVGPLGVAYKSPGGPITPLDMLFGHSASIAAGYHEMTHKTGFTEDSLKELFHRSGFVRVVTRRHRFDLWGRGEKAAEDEASPSPGS